MLCTNLCIVVLLNRYIIVSIFNIVNFTSNIFAIFTLFNDYSLHFNHFQIISEADPESEVSESESNRKFDQTVNEDDIAETVKAVMKKNKEQHANMQQAFLHLDQDRSGFIDRDKLMKITDNFNLQVPRHVIDKVVTYIVNQAFHRLCNFILKHVLYRTVEVKYLVDLAIYMASGCLIWNLHFSVPFHHF